MLRNPSEKDFQGVVTGNLILNCPIARQDISNAHQIFGPDLESVRRKTVRRAPAPVVGDYVVVPWELVEANTPVKLAADMFFVDGLAFLMTVLRRIKFVTAKHVPMRMAASLSKHLHRVLLVYGRAGFKVRNILMDGEFEKIKELMPTVECIPQRMKIEFICFIVLWLNAFLVKTGISDRFCPKSYLCSHDSTTRSTARCHPGLIVIYMTSQIHQTQWSLGHTKGLLWSRWVTYKVA
jgi:hypothetical protein